MRISSAIHSSRQLFCGLLALAACVFATPARAGLTVDVHLYHDINGYYFFPFLSTNTTPPDFPAGDYAIASWQFPGNGSVLYYHTTNTDFVFDSGTGTYYTDFDSFLYGITNQPWSIWVTNSTSTNQYLFGVTVTGLTSNSFGAPAVVTFPIYNQTYVTNLPVFTWTGPANWTGTLQAWDYLIDTNGNYNYVDSTSLNPGSTNWTPSVTLPDGTNSFTVYYDSNLTATVIASTPTNTSGQVISGWTSTAQIETSQGIQFIVGQLSILGGSGGHTNVTYYSFEDDNLFAQDFSGHGNNINSYSNFGDPTNAPYMTNDAAAGSFAVGYTGSGWQSPPTNLVAALTGSFSVSLWASPSSYPGNDTDTADSGAGLLAANSDQTIPMALTGHKLAFLTGGNAPDTLHSITSINTGTYVHLVVTRDQSTGEKKIYVNGVLDASDIGAAGPLLTGSDPSLFLGMNTTFASGFIGEMDEVQIYSGVLSADDVAYLYNHPGSTVADTIGPINLVTNGGFETGDLTGWTLFQDDGGIFADDGSVLGIMPHSGSFDAAFGTVGAIGYLSQTIPTTAGASYLLSFWLNSPDGLTPSEFLVSWDGTTLFDETNLPVMGWTNLQFVVTATGSNTVLQFGAEDDPSYLGLDDVSVVSTQAGGQSLADALNATNLTWTTGGDKPWFVEANVTHDAVSAAQSGLITDSQISWIETTAPADGQLSFFWKVSSELNFNFLTFYINGVPQDFISGEVDWTQDTFPVSSGDTLHWEYSKDDSVSQGQDAGWLDQVQFTPQTTPLPVELTNPQTAGGNFQFSFQSQLGFTHTVLYSTNLTSGSWQTYTNIPGDGNPMMISIPLSFFSPSQQVFIRLSTQ